MTEIREGGGRGASTSRERALALGRRFEERHLPSALRRLAQWKGFDARADTDLVDELRQELALDCLAHADAIVRATDDERARRWFRLVHQVHYRLRARTARGLARFEELDAIAVERPDAGDAAFESTPALAPMRTVAEHAVHLQNGRLNADATAKALGIERRRFKSVWRDLAAHLGFGAEYLDYWRRRLLEALLAYACDLLRARDGVALASERRLAPADPESRRARIERIRIAFSSHPTPHDVKRALGQVTKQPDDASAAVRAATLVAPADPVVALWTFECAVDTGRHAEAARAIRRAGVARAVLRVPIVLARARLLEARGGFMRAWRMLRRADARDPDPRLGESAARLARAMPAAAIARRSTPSVGVAHARSARKG